jgi:hypothetical protein
MYQEICETELPSVLSFSKQQLAISHSTEADKAKVLPTLPKLLGRTRINIMFIMIFIMS